MPEGRLPLDPVTLAFDHVKAMRACVPDPLTHNQMASIKRQLAAAGGVSVLTDPEHDLAGVKSTLSDEQRLVVSLEDGDYATPELAPRALDGWSVERLAEAGAQVVKIFFWYETGAGGEAARNFLQQISNDCQSVGIPLLAEPILVTADGDDHVDALLTAVHELTILGATALKLEFPGGPDGDLDRAALACQQITEVSTVPWYLLSQGVSFDMFQPQVATAIRGGASGCVVGRAVWGDVIDPTGLSDGAHQTIHKRVSILRDLVESSRPAPTTKDDE
jgi:tagatose-1,6-bisphosphate aldolase